MRRFPQRPRRRLNLGRGRPRRGGSRHLVLATAGLGLYLAALWFGIVVVGDTPVRSALMAALIVAIAGTGYVFTRRPATSDD